MTNNTQNSELFWSFIDLLPPSVNKRFGTSKGGGRIFTDSYYKKFREAFVVRLRVDLKVKSLPLPEKHLWKITLMFLGDWGSYEDYLRAGVKLKDAIGNVGEDKPDLDNLFKISIDAAKEFVQNDDRFVNEVHGFKIQWPQLKGVVISVAENRHYEFKDLENLGTPKWLIDKILAPKKESGDELVSW